jgi:hypothetical protein
MFDPISIGLFLGGALISREATRDAAKREIAAARNERDNHFVNLRNSAERGGFNPLTALRATGGGGYGQYVPLISRSPIGEGNRAMGQYASSFMRDAAFTHVNQMHEIKLNRMNNEAALKRDNLSREFQKELQKMERVTPEQVKSEEVPLLDTNGEQILDNEGNPIFMHSLNQEVQPMWILVRNPVTNKVFAYPNPELADMGPAEFATFMGLTAAFEKHADDGTDFTYGGMGLPAQPRLGRGVKTLGDNGTFSFPENTLTRSMGWPQGVNNAAN